MKLLLHICCSPCSIYPLKELSKDADNQVKGLYFNPNIHPEEEYLRRRAAVEEYSKNNHLEVIYSKYNPDLFFKRILKNEEKPERCRICWYMRLEETARFAKANGFDTFSTTLLISPYQEHLIIKDLGFDLAKKHKIAFYYRDFRIGFRDSQNEAREHRLYRQKYCGCRYSLLEKNTKFK